MTLTRRDFVTGCAAGAFVPATACRAAQVGTQVAPEVFGAVGDGTTDDYEAFQRLAAEVSSTGGGTVRLAPGRTYLLNRFIRPNNGVSDVNFRGCSGLIIDGNGATISTKGDFFRDIKTTRGLAGLRFEDCSNLQLHNVQLLGNVQRTTRAAGLTEAPTHGLIFAGCTDVIIDRVLCRHFAGDGLVIRESARSVASLHPASRRFSVRNSRFLFNARQGLTVSQLRDAVFDNCDFSYTGYVDTTSSTGFYGHHAPSAGIDIEPDYTPSSNHPVDVLTGNLTFRNCRMVGNFGTTISAAELRGTEPTIENVVVEGCTLEASQASTSRYGLIFDVPGGLITRCTIKMHDKTAFLGWYEQSPASPRLTGNVISGVNAGPDRPLLVVRRTHGSPVVEGNRFVVAERPDRVPSIVRPQPLRVDNPNAVMRDNQFVAQP